MQVSVQPRLRFPGESVIRGAVGPPPWRGTGIAADVLVWPRCRFEGRKYVVASLPAAVLRKGRVRHAA